MEMLKILIETIYNTLILVPKLILSVFPLYNTLSSFQQNLIAAALGVSPVLIGLIYKGAKMAFKQLDTKAR